MESVSESMAVLSLNKPPCMVKASSTSSSPGGGEDLGKVEGDNVMGKDGSKAVSPDVAAILQAPHVTTSSMCNLVYMLSSRSKTMIRDMEDCIAFAGSAHEGMRALAVDAKAIIAWYKQQKKDDSEVQQAVSQSLADKVSDKLLGLVSFARLMADKVFSKFQGFAALIEELRRDKGDTMEKKKGTSIDVAAILCASNMTPSLWNSISEKLSSQLLAIQRDTAESKRCSDSAFEALEALEVDLQYTMAWYHQQEEDDFAAQQVSSDPKDDASSKLRNFHTIFCSLSSTLQDGPAQIKRATDYHKFLDELLVDSQFIVQELVNVFDFITQQDAIDLDDKGT